MQNRILKKVILTSVFQAVKDQLEGIALPSIGKFLRHCILHIYHHAAPNDIDSLWSLFPPTCHCDYGRR